MKVFQFWNKKRDNKKRRTGRNIESLPDRKLKLIGLFLRTREARGYIFSISLDKPGDFALIKLNPLFHFMRKSGELDLHLKKL